MIAGRRSITTAAWLVLAVCGWSRLAFAAQDTITTEISDLLRDSVEWIPLVLPNSEEETYLRYLQAAGVVRQYPWSSRGFSPQESKRLRVKVGTHPWSRSARFTTGNRRAHFLPVDTEVRLNSAFPYGSNDGPVWAGRGITAKMTAGAALQFGPVSLTVAPTAFITQNASFELYNNGQAGDLRFGDALNPMWVDRPQRFGEKPYGRLDPGNSTLRADIAGVGVGLSTANMAWGPAELYPFVLGTNAGGFPHAFLGTSRPTNVWVGSFHGRVMWGHLAQTAYSPVDGSPSYISQDEPGTRRFASGLVFTFEPRGVPGLELGLVRFFHSPWPPSGIPSSYWSKPFENILKNNLSGAPDFVDPGTSADNQLISGFARWAFPRAGFEMYAEYGREDHSWDKRDFVQEPDHSRTYGLGLRKTIRPRPDRLDGVTLEIINFQLPHLMRNLRGEGGVYGHSVLRQGHTQRGQLLGADVGVGTAAGSTFRWDTYTVRGRTAFELHRIVRAEAGAFYDGGYITPRGSDVQYAVGAMRMWRLSSMEMRAGVTLIHELNRHFRKDVTSISTTFGLRIPLSDQ